MEQKEVYIEKTQFSKRILAISMTMLIILLSITIYFIYLGLDATIMASITGGWMAAVTGIFGLYQWKEKSVYKMQKFLWFIKQLPERYEDNLSELSQIIMAIFGSGD